MGSKQTQQRRLERTICGLVNKPPDTMYDIGVGEKSEYLTLKEAWPDMRIYGCEPHPHVFNRLLPRFPGTLVPVAIDKLDPNSNDDDPPKKNLMRVGGSFSLLSGDPSKSFSTVATVDTWTLDKFDNRMGYPDRILLWMDIEGSELRALQSGIGLMASGRVKWVNLEVRAHPPDTGWCSAEDVHRFLTKLRYKPVKKYADQQTHYDIIYMHESELS